MSSEIFNSPITAAADKSLSIEIQNDENTKKLNNMNEPRAAAVNSIESDEEMLKMSIEFPNPPESRSNTPGTASRIGPYILTKTIGTGSTGKVKLGHHAATNEKVAIKIMSKEAINKSGSAGKVEREIALMKLIEHPHILRLIDVYESTNDIYVVTDYAEGGELFDYLIKKGRLRESEALRIFRQIIVGLDYCHQHLIFHRDLKPENIMLDKERNIKIVDFGMAALQRQGAKLETSCGSPHYACPEIIRGERYDGGPADIWSCGVILYALLLGSLPFDDGNVRKLLGIVKTGVFSIPPEANLNPAAVDLIKKMIVVDPKQRITMEQIYSHPWFISSGSSTSTPVPIYKKIEIRLEYQSTGLIDDDIVETLLLLGWCDKRAVLDKLLEEEYNMEKAVYFLLSKWRVKYLENVPLTARWDQGSSARRRTESFNSLYHSRSSLALPERRHSAKPEAIDSPIHSMEDVRTFHNVAAKQTGRKSESGPTSSAIISASAIAQYSSSNSSSSRTSRIMAMQSAATGNMTSNAAAYVHSPLTVSVSSSTSTASPASSKVAPVGVIHQAAEKKSWFNHVFKFRPESKFFATFFKTRLELSYALAATLNRLRIVYQRQDEFFFKCKSDTGVKFKIVINESLQEGFSTFTVTHQQGKLDKFEEEINKLFLDNNSWKLQ